MPTLPFDRSYALHHGCSGHWLHRGSRTLHTVLPNSMRAWLISPGWSASSTIVVAPDQRTSRVDLAFGEACTANTRLRRRFTFPSSCKYQPVHNQLKWVKRATHNWYALVICNRTDGPGAVPSDARYLCFHVFGVIR